MLIKERHEIIIKHHPYCESLNKKLMEDVKTFRFYSPEELPFNTNIQGTQYNFGRRNKNEWTPSICLLVDWIYQLIGNISQGAEELDGKPRSTVWFARYNKGDYTKEHDHQLHALFAFVYFVNAPSGSSSLFFPTSGKKIKAEEGKVVIFPGNVRHSVPPNKCDNRIVVAGNIGYDFST